MISSYILYSSIRNKINAKIEKEQENYRRHKILSASWLLSLINILGVSPSRLSRDRALTEYNLNAPLLQGARGRVLSGFRPPSMAVPLDSDPFAALRPCRPLTRPIGEKFYLFGIVKLYLGHLKDLFTILCDIGHKANQMQVLCYPPSVLLGNCVLVLSSPDFTL